MKRRDQGISNAWSFLLGFVILSVVVPGVLIGPARAVRIIGSAVSSTVMQSAAPEAVVQQQHVLPVVQVVSSERKLIYNDVHFPIAITNSGEDDVLVEIDTTSATPFGPYRMFTIGEPDSDLLSGPLALWIAGRLGVPVPFNQLVYLQRDGSDAGIHELKEFVSGKFEEYRNLTDHSVAVLRVKDGLDVNTDPWKSTEHWVIDEADETAITQLRSLIELLNDTLIATTDRRTQLELLIDVEAFNRYHAAVFMLGANKQAVPSIAIVLNPRTEKFYPVLIDAPLVPASSDLLIGEEIDLLSQRMMAISDWRKQRDGFIQAALKEIHTNGAFTEKLTELSDVLRPSLRTVSSSRRPLFSMQALGTTGAGAEWSGEDLRARVAAHWDRSLPLVAGETVTVDPITP